MNPSLEHAKVLLKKAMDDHYVFQRLMGDPNVPSWSLGFHAEQAVEKTIKAVLTFKMVVYPRTHNISMLLELCRKHGLNLPPYSDELTNLTPYGVALRYDDVIIEEVPFDRKKLSDIIESAIEWANELLP